MSNTPIQISTDLSKILERIENKLENLQKDVTDIKVGQARLEEKVEGLSKRIDNQEFVSRGVLIGLIIAIAGGAAKLFGFVGNP